MMATERTAEDDKPFDEWLADLEAKYGKEVAQVIARYEPRPRKNPALSWAKRNGKRREHLRGAPENPDAPASAVDFRHHRSRIEGGK